MLPLLISVYNLFTLYFVAASVFGYGACQSEQMIDVVFQRVSQAGNCLCVYQSIIINYFHQFTIHRQRTPYKPEEGGHPLRIIVKPLTQPHPILNTTTLHIPPLHTGNSMSPLLCQLLLTLLLLLESTTTIKQLNSPDFDQALKVCFGINNNSNKTIWASLESNSMSS